MRLLNVCVVDAESSLSPSLTLGLPNCIQNKALDLEAAQHAEALRGGILVESVGVPAPSSPYRGS